MGKLGQWLQVSANVGILFGLILVGLQIDQNTELTRLGFYSAEEDGFIFLDGMKAGETLAAAWAKAIDDPDSLTTEEMIQLDGFLDGILDQIGRRDYLHQQGLYEHAPEEQIQWLIPKYFGNRFAQAWWQEKRDVWNDDLAGAVDQAVAMVDEDTQHRQFSAIRRTLNSDK